MPNPDGRDLISYVKRSLEEEEEFHFLRFEFLQRLNIVQLEVKLARMKSRIQKEQIIHPDESELLQNTLQAYATAIRDYRFLKGQKSLGKTEVRDRNFLLERFFQSEEDFNDPFSSHYAYFQDAEARIDPLRDAFMKQLPSRLTWSHEERRQRKREYMDGKAPKEVSHFVDQTVRFVVAITGGLFLVVPMVVMTIQPSVLKSLITVSTFVLLFALILAFAVKVSNVETLISTATYAAVLVVFVGTSTGNNA